MARLVAFTLLFGTALPIAPVAAQSTETSAASQAEPLVPASAVQDTSPPAENGQSEEEPAFLRLRREEGQPVALETAVVTYRSRESRLRVDLIGAVHVGEAAYYEQLNELFDEYDVLLYELVAEEGTVIPPGGRSEQGGFNPIGMLQDGTKNMLGLESQLAKINYQKPHFVRADLTPQQIAAKMAERGDTAITIALDTFADAMRQQNLAAQVATSDSLADLEDLRLSDLLSNPLKMKRVMAAQFATTGALDKSLGESLNQLLIVDRNARALKVLREQQELGHRKIGIFYGAAHLPDFDRRLTKEFSLKRKRTRWLTAWDLTQAKQPELSQPASLLLNMLKALEP